MASVFPPVDPRERSIQQLRLVLATLVANVFSVSWNSLYTQAQDIWKKRNPSFSLRGLSYKKRRLKRPKVWDVWNINSEFGTFHNNVKRPKLWIYVSNVPDFRTFETSFLIGETSGDKEGEWRRNGNLWNGLFLKIEGAVWLRAKRVCKHWPLFCLRPTTFPVLVNVSSEARSYALSGRNPPLLASGNNHNS